MNNIVTFEIAKIAKEKGFKEEVNNYWCNYYTGEPLNKWKLIKKEGVQTGFGFCEYPACTYHELINWIFNNEHVYDHTPFNENVPKELQYSIIEWLEFWYNLLKDCPLKYEFKGRLLEWFESVNAPSIIMVKTEGRNNKKSRKEAEHKGILKIFKLLKND